MTSFPSEVLSLFGPQGERVHAAHGQQQESNAEQKRPIEVRRQY
ncbi:hypothetical protein ACFUC1_03100 [Pedococcus sp. NPDC057267]